MPATCSVCDGDVSSIKPSEVISCNDCKQTFHLECVKDEVEEKKTRSGKQWRCKDCRKSASTKSSVSSGVSTPLTKDFIISVLDEFKKEVFNELKSFRNDMLEVTNSIQFLSDKVDTANSLMSEIKNEMKELKKENAELREKNAHLCSSVTELQDRVRSLEQYTRRNNIEISGVPATPMEDVISIVKDVGAALGVQVEGPEISAAHRVPSYRSERSQSLVVQFSSRLIRDKLLEKFREKKGEITANNVNAAFPKDKIYVNEHLSPTNKIFLAKLKKKCREIGYQYVWCREGKFFVRRVNGEKCRRIDNDSDINSLK